MGSDSFANDEVEDEGKGCEEGFVQGWKYD